MSAASQATRKLAENSEARRDHHVGLSFLMDAFARSVRHAAKLLCVRQIALVQTSYASARFRRPLTKT